VHCGDAQHQREHHAHAEPLPAADPAQPD
jgi:hypothetical protein